LLNEHFQAKLADFGLSKIIPTEGGTHVSTVVAGTPGYLDPEWVLQLHFPLPLHHFLGKKYYSCGCLCQENLTENKLSCILFLSCRYFITNRLTEKSDVYSFGVVLLEIITNQAVIMRGEDSIHISDWVRSLVVKGDMKAIVDSRLEGDYDTNSVWKAVEIATACVSSNMNRRPVTSEIVIELKESLSMEVARTKYRGNHSTDLGVTLNMNTEFIPQAR